MTEPHDTERRMKIYLMERYPDYAAAVSSIETRDGASQFLEWIAQLPPDNRRALLDKHFGLTNEGKHVVMVRLSDMPDASMDGLYAMAEELIDKVIKEKPKASKGKIEVLP